LGFRFILDVTGTKRPKQRSLRPGTRADLLRVIAEQGGNILHIHHTQGEGDMPVLEARVVLELETRGRDHGASIRKAMLGNGYEIQ
jgi:threonine dehydratase